MPIVQGPKHIIMKEDTTETIKLHMDHPDLSSSLYISMKSLHGGILSLNETSGLNVKTDHGSIVGKGSVFSWNRALRQLSYTPPLHYNIESSRILNEIRIEAMEILETSQSTKSTHVVFIKVEPMPDPQTWKLEGLANGSPIQSPTEISGSIVFKEDSSIKLSVALLDEDEIRRNGGQEDSYSVFISSSSGSFQLSTYNGIFMKSGQNKSSVLHFQASFSSIKEALDNFIYTPKPNFNGNDIITLFCSDGPYFNTTMKIPLVILPEIDIPKVEISSYIVQCEEGMACNLHNMFSVEDPDLNSKLTIHIKSEIGTVSFPGTFDLASRSITLIRGSSRGDKSFILEGTRDDLEEVITNLIYLPQPNIAPTMDTISFSVHVSSNDVQMNLESKSEVPVIVMKNSVNAPFIRYDEITYHDDDLCPSSFHLTNSSENFCHGHTHVSPILCKEDEQCDFGKFSFDGDDSVIYELEVYVENGFLSFNGNTDGIQVSPIEVKGIGYPRLYIRGDSNHLNRAFSELCYTPGENFVGKDTVQLKLFESTSSDQRLRHDVFKPVLHALKIDVIVAATFDKIKLDVPSELFFVNEDENTKLGGITIHQNDNNYSAVEARLWSFNGQFLLPFLPSYGVRVFHTATSKNAAPPRNETSSWSNIVICGDIDAIATALDSLSFLADRHFNSAEEGNYASVHVGVRRTESCNDINPSDLPDDNDFEDSISVLIHVHSINDVPEIVMKTIGKEHLCLHYQQYDLCIDEDHEVKLPTEIVDVDSDIIQVDIRTDGFGKVAVSHGDYHHKNAYFIEGDGDGDYYDRIYFKGTLSDVNEYLLNLCIMGKEDYNGNGTLFVETRDQFGGETSVQINVMTNPVQDSLVLWFVVDSKLNEPLVTFAEGEKRILGRDWLESGDSYMEASSKVSSSLHHDDEYQVRALSGARMFTISNGDKHVLDTDICVRIIIDDGLISIDNIEGITLDTSHVDVYLTRGETVYEYSGTVESVNKASENIIYQAAEGRPGIVHFHVDVTRETCEDFITADSKSSICSCDFERPEAQRDFEISVTNTKTS